MASIEVIPRDVPDWERLRDLRLEMLADTPTAYVESLADAQKLTDDEWRDRAGWGNRPGSVGLVAVDRDVDRFVGTMSAFRDEAVDKTWLVAVYVAPAYRGGEAPRVVDLLLDAVEAWARDDQGLDRLWLHVHEDNASAQRFYLRRGYEFTGDHCVYPLDPAKRELEMARALR